MRKKQKRSAIDRDAAARLFEQYHKFAFLAGYRRTRSEEKALEVVQETFTRIFEHWESLEKVPEEALKKYIYVAARNTAIDLFANEYEKEEPVEDQKLSEQMGGSAEGTEDAALKREEVRYIKNILERLKSEDRLLLEMVYLQGLQIKEAAVLLGLSQETAKKRTQRVRKKLRNILEREGIRYDW